MNRRAAPCGVVTVLVALGACQATPAHLPPRETTYQATPAPTATHGCEEPCTSGPTSTSTDAARATATPAKPSSTATHGASAPTATPKPARSTSTPPPYSRDQFGSGWADPDHNGCDGRQDAIQRATTDQHRTSACYVAVGDVTDWYTGRVCDDCATRGFDVDHVVALADAWRSGASSWTRGRRVAYANDPLVLVVTGASLNRSKSDKGPDEWAPVDHAHACQYVKRYRQIKNTWRLHTTATQRAAIRRTLVTC